jgi:long-chain fatty acid transport protein
MRRSKNNVLAILLVFMFSAISVNADDSHYINSIVGDRAADLGGAYTAVSDDSSGCFYNPAGIVLSPSGKFSASVNAVNTSTKTYKDVLTGISGNKMDWEQKSFSLLPNYFGIVQKFGPGMLGFSYAVPESVQMRQKQTFSNIQGASSIDTFTVNLDDTDKTYLFGPSYAMKITDSLSMGLTLYYYYRDVEIITNQFIRFTSGDDVIANQYSTRTDHGIKPVLGIMFDP